MATRLVTQYWMVQIRAAPEIERIIKELAVENTRSVGSMVGILLREALEHRGVEVEAK